MKLWKCIISSGSTRVCCGNNTEIYVVAKNYAEAEKILLSDKNNHWVWNHHHQIFSIELIDHPIMISD